MQATLEKWVESKGANVSATTATATRRRRVVSLFDRHGLAASPWAALGFECTAYDGVGRTATNGVEGVGGVQGVRIERAKLSNREEILACLGSTEDIAFVVAMPPCRDLCAAGARWWTKKRGRDPNFQENAEKYLKALYETLDTTGIPFMVLVPSSPYIRRCFNRRAFAFSPHEFGGHLTQDTFHPLFSEIPPQDAYTKRTLCFHGRGVRMPWKKPVQPKFEAIRLKTGRTKRVSPIMASRRNTGARTAPPLAFCSAVASLNAHVHAVSATPSGGRTPP
jgi:hypothetical protein